MIPASYEHLIGSTIDSGRYAVHNVLGVGAFGVVFRAIDLRTNATVAIKCLQNSGLTARQRLFLCRELSLHQQCSSHPGVVSIHNVIETKELIFIVLDFCPAGDLFGMITEQQRYLGDDALISSVFLQLIDSVAHLHRQGIYHRDLKPENILCEDGGRIVKLADFGLATTDKISTDFGCGSSFFISPETAGGVFDALESYHPGPNDIWALGVILVNLTCARNPWRTATIQDDTFLAFLRDPCYIERILPISPACHVILQAIFTIDPRRRITLSKLREMVARVDRWTLTREEIELQGPSRAAAAQVARADGGKAARLRAQARAEESRRQAAAALASHKTIREDLFRSASSDGSLSRSSRATEPGVFTDRSSSTTSSSPASHHGFPISAPRSASPPFSPTTAAHDPAAHLAPRSANITLVSSAEISPKTKATKASVFAADSHSSSSPSASLPPAAEPAAAAPLEADLTRVHSLVQSLVDVKLGKKLLLESPSSPTPSSPTPAAERKAATVPERPKVVRRMSSFFFKGAFGGGKTVV